MPSRLRPLMPTEECRLRRCPWSTLLMLLLPISATLAVEDAATWGGFRDGWRLAHRAQIEGPRQSGERVDSLHGWDALAYDAALRLEFGPPAHLDAAVEIRLVARQDLDGLDLQLRGYALDSARVNGQAVPFTRVDDQLWLHLSDQPLAAGDSATVHLHYAGAPVWQDGLGLSVSGQIAYTLSDPWGTRNWLACFDEPHDKAVWSLAVRADSTCATLANGELVGVTHHGDGTSTWAYRHDAPMSSYLASFVTGRLSILEDDWQGLPLRWFVYPQHVAPAWQAVSRVDQMFDCFTGLWGDYPFTSYAMGEAPIYGGFGGMEHQTCTTIGSGIIAAGLAYESIIAHELSHMWWGDAVTPVDFRHVWLNEGWATYAEAYYFQHLAGGDEQAFLDYLHEIHQTYLNWDTQFLPIFAPPLDDLFNVSQYEKAASVIHMLRDLMGGTAFHQAQRDWLATHRYGTVDTEEYQAAMEAACGQDLDWFFQQWIYGGGYPTYHTVTEHQDGDASCRVHLTVNQSHPVQSSFRARLPLRIQTSLAQLDTLVWIEQPSTQLSWTLLGEFDTLLFNVNETVLCRHVVVPPVPGPPRWRLRGFALDDSTGGNGDGDLAVGESGWLALELENIGGWDTGIQISLTSNDVSVQGTWPTLIEAGGGTVVALPTGHVALADWNLPAMDYARLELHSLSDSYGEETGTIRLPMGDPWLLLATGPTQEDLRPYLAVMLDSLRLFSDPLSPGAEPLPDPGLPEHQALLWFTGDAGQSLSAVQQEWLLEAFMQSTPLVVSGQDAWDSPAADCLFHPLAGDVSDVVVDGLPGTPFAGMSALLIGAAGANNQSAPSSLAACDQPGFCVVEPLAVYRNSQAPAILGVAACDEEMSLIVCGFGLEAISGMAGTDSRLDWLAALAEFMVPGSPVPPATEDVARATSWVLEAPHPNPFNPVAHATYQLPRPAHVELRVHDLLGRECLTLASGWRPAGRHVLRIETGGLASGLYVLSMQAEGRRQAHRLLLVR